MNTNLRIPIIALAACLPIHAYELHEWGTFTTVSGSDGRLLTGLEREEEVLPPFVRTHPGFPRPRIGDPGSIAALLAKPVPLPVRNVKVKMETPVIYFHSDSGFQATVKVGFEGGTISQWYPERSGGETFRIFNPRSAAGPRYLDFSKPYRGSIEWKVDVLSPAVGREAIIFNPEDLLQWTRARVPEANVVRDSAGNTEGFLFYRGLGSFDPGLETRVSSDETLHLRNRTGRRVPYLLAYERLENGATRWTERHDLEPDGTLSISGSDLRPAAGNGFDRSLYRSITGNLAARGLLESEAEAMVRTWWSSYFEAPGLRVFWILPDDLTNRILPLEVTPEPEKTVRVLVGRSEVIRPRQERAWLAQANSNDPTEGQLWLSKVGSDRFGLAYRERIELLQKQEKARLNRR